MNNKKFLAIFDFCDTLFKGQSVSYFYNYLVEQQRILKEFYIKVRNKLNSFDSVESKKYKEYLFRPFKGASKYYFDKISKEFFETIIQKRLYDKVLQELLLHKKRGDFIVIVSGGLECYLKYFANYYKVDLLISTKLKFENNIFTGKIEGRECIGEEKVNKLKKILDLRKFDISNSYVYSDDKSDMPLFSLVKNKIVISKFNENIDWIDNTFQIIRV